MALTPKLEMRQSQSLLMTPQLRQAINLLQMSNLELSEVIEQELGKNPLLEREDDTSRDEEPLPRTIDDDGAVAGQAEEEFAPDNIDYDSNFDDFGSDSAGYEETGYDWADYNRGKNPHLDEDFDYCEKKLADTTSVYTLIEQQIDLSFTSPRHKIIARLLSEGLDDAGYFRGNTSDIAQRLRTSEKEVREVLQKMKSFEPDGLFAENLKECLTIQLRDKNRCDPAMALLLDNLGLLAERRLKDLQKICGVDAEDLDGMIAELKTLNPKPLAKYNNDITSYIIPDVFVKRNAAGDYRIELNNMSLPRLLINRAYYSEIIRRDKSSRRFLKENLSHANFLIKAMHQRADTILRVSEEIVRRQLDFFEKGIDYLKPLSLRDVAYSLEMHESTVSRVTNRKYMHTPRGLFELKFFFSQAAGSYIGNEDTSTLAIKHKIKQLIEAETPDNILSDDNIVSLLANEGVKIARRTVAKYREALKLPTSAERKRQKRA
ncbi:MAG: RNA polymerase factor sigma-54 [Proteobacteria bacterium]|nr:RNA polymerase factor sigma-54 [Pseudomonadota bacterium]